MAEEKPSAEGGPRNAWEDLNASPEERHAYHLRRMAARREAAASLGNAVVARVTERLAAFTAPVDDRAIEREFGRQRQRAQRSPSWRGPHHGRTFDDATKLRLATHEECAAGFLATWGFSLTDKDREVFRLPIVSSGFSSETKAREIYSRLQTALHDAAEFGERHYNQGSTPATIALAELWGTLPTLPPLEGLPGYAKSESDRARLVKGWQGMALQGLGRLLQGRELAELSILLGIADPPYGKLMIEKGKMSVAQVIDWEKKRLDKVD